MPIVRVTLDISTELDPGQVFELVEKYTRDYLAIVEGSAVRIAGSAPQPVTSPNELKVIRPLSWKPGRN